MHLQPLEIRLQSEMKLRLDAQLECEMQIASIFNRSKDAAFF